MTIDGSVMSAAKQAASSAAERAIDKAADTTVNDEYIGTGIEADAEAAGVDGEAY
jgi:hypothetical protein